MTATSAPGVLTGVDHYENFPVASVLVPRALRPAVIALYRFARYADDVADEGEAPATQRLQELDRLRDALRHPDRAQHPFVSPLQPHLASGGLGAAECLDLLSAFRQDVEVHRYADSEQLLDYCRRSANPVGRQVLQLFGCRSPANERWSDAICTALQLINFLQDLALDWRRGRLYLPLDELAAAGLSETDLREAVDAGTAPPPLRALLADQTARAVALLESGAPLVRSVPSRLAWELRGTLAGGRRIVELLARGGFDPIASRPRLRWRDAFALVRLMLTPARLR